MGQPHKKYHITDDGKIYEIRDDGILVAKGSVDSLKSNFRQNDPSSKYQITPDGKIYRIEADGSVTYLGNADEMRPPHEPPPYVRQPSQGTSPYVQQTASDISQPEPEYVYRGPKKKSHVWIWILALLVILGAGVAGYFYYEQSAHYNDRSAETESVYKNEPAEEIPATTEMTEVEQPSEAVQAAPMPQSVDFYGSIGEASIRGSFNFEGAYPYGYLTYYGTGDDSLTFDLTGSFEDPRTWTVSYCGETDGVIYLDYFDPDSKSLARGTYVQYSDGHGLDVELYQ